MSEVIGKVRTTSGPDLRRRCRNHNEWARQDSNRIWSGAARTLAHLSTEHITRCLRGYRAPTSVRDPAKGDPAAHMCRYVRLNMKRPPA